MKNFNVGHRANFQDKLIVNLHLSFPVRSILRGTTIGIALTGNQSPLDVKTLSSLLIPNSDRTLSVDRPLFAALRRITGNVNRIDVHSLGPFHIQDEMIITKSLYTLNSSSSIFTVNKVDKCKTLQRITNIEAVIIY